MKNQATCIFLSIIITVFCTDNIWAQAPAPDITVSVGLFKLKNLYNQQIGDQSRLLNGIKYVEFATPHKGYAYFLTDSFQNANLRYDNTDFSNIPILFDINREMIVISHPGDGGLMSLLNTKLDRFTVAGHTFIKIDADSTQKTLKTGFYDLLYQGNTQLVARREKITQEERSGAAFLKIFEEHVTYYLRKGNSYYAVSGRGAMLDVLKDKKKELQSFLKTNALDFKIMPEEAMAKLAARYDQLNK